MIDPDTQTALALLTCLGVLAVGYLLHAAGPISDTRDADMDDEDSDDYDPE